MLVALVERVSIPDSLLLSLIGFAIVFIVLVALMAMIKIVTAVMASIENGKKEPLTAPETQASAKAAISSGKVPAIGSVGECRLHTVDDKTAALLMAIVADEIRAPLNELRFISIKELKSGGYSK